MTAFAVGCLAYHANERGTRERQAQPLPDDLVVVHDERGNLL